MRTLLVVCFVYLLYAQTPQAPAQSKRPQAQKQTQAQTAQDKPGDIPPRPSSPGTTNSSGVGEPASDTKAHNSNQSSGGFEQIKSVSDFLAQWALVAIGFFGVRAALRTLKAMTKQTEIIDGSLRVSQDSLVEMRQYVTLTERLATAATESNTLTRESNDITRLSTDLTRQSLALVQATERADVSIGAIAFKADPHPVMESPLIVEIKNTGRTQATVSKVSIRLTVFPYDQTASSNLGYSHSRGSFNVGAKSNYEFPWRNVFWELGAETLTEMNQGKVYCRAIVEVSYTDVFGNPYTIKDGRLREIDGEWSNDPTPVT